MIVTFWDRAWQQRGAMLTDLHPRDHPVHLLAERFSLGAWLLDQVGAGRPVYATVDQDDGGRWSGRLKMTIRHENPGCKCQRVEVQFTENTV